MYKWSKRFLSFTLLLTFATPVMAAHHQPKYKNLRYQENWSGLKNQPTGDIFDPLKFIPLSPNGDAYLSFGSQLRLRGEGWSNFGFASTANNKEGDPSRDGAFGIGWLRTHADLHLWDYFRFYAEVKNSLATPRNLPGGVRSIDMDSFNIQNLFIDLKMPFGSGNYVLLRPGRQEIDLGKQRLISSLPWVNSRRTFDGVSAIGKVGPFKSHAFYAQLVAGDNLKTDPFGLQLNTSNLLNSNSANTFIYGLYNNKKFKGLGLDSDLYWLGIHKDKTKFGSNEGAEDRQTIGARLGGKLPMNLDYDLEGGYQFGQFSDQSISAFFVASQLGHKFNVPTNPRLYVGFDYASGDTDPNDKTLGTFNQYLPLAHAYHGFADAFGRSNIIDFSGGLSLKPFKPLLIKLDAHYLMRASATDAMYGVTGAASRAGDAGSTLPLGIEFDLTAKYKLGRHSALQFGLSHLIPGSFIGESGQSNGITFAYLQSIYTF